MARIAFLSISDGRALVARDLASFVRAIEKRLAVGGIQKTPWPQTVSVMTGLIQEIPTETVGVRPRDCLLTTTAPKVIVGTRTAHRKRIDMSWTSGMSTQGHERKSTDSSEQPVIDGSSTGGV